MAAVLVGRKQEATEIQNSLVFWSFLARSYQCFCAVLQVDEMQTKGNYVPPALDLKNVV